MAKFGATGSRFAEDRSSDEFDDREQQAEQLEF